MRAKIREALDDPRPSIPAKQAFADLRAFHEEQGEAPSVAHKVVFRPAAAADLRRFYLTVSEYVGYGRAGGYRDRIKAACMSLGTFPERSTVRDRLLLGLRIIGFEWSNSIALPVSGDTVESSRRSGSARIS